MTHPPDSYLNHLGLLRYATRLKEPSGLYYKQTNGRLCFYDKNRVQSKKERYLNYTKIEMCVEI